MRFKNWIDLTENLAGPGGGPDLQPIDVLAVSKEIARRGAGAFQQTGDQPPKPAKTATAGYEDPRFGKKFMKKNEPVPSKKGTGSF